MSVRLSVPSLFFSFSSTQYNFRRPLPRISARKSFFTPAILYYHDRRVFLPYSPQKKAHVRPSSFTVFVLPRPLHRRRHISFIPISPPNLTPILQYFSASKRTPLLSPLPQTTLPSPGHDVVLANTETPTRASLGYTTASLLNHPEELENFVKSLAKLACQKEARTSFVKFQEWLERHGPFDVVVDGANLGLANQHKFSFFEIARVVNQMREISPSRKLPLVVLHQIRVTGGPAQHPNNKKLLESWKRAGALYSTPHGSNDDWYWLYAAVSSKCLLVTNDEMRDHLFNLLGNNFFPRWKEKHQVRLKPSINGLTLLMPPPYSHVIQESEQGSWHIPTVTGDDLETPRQWVCATRTRPACIGSITMT